MCAFYITKAVKYLLYIMILAPHATAVVHVDYTKLSSAVVL